MHRLSFNGLSGGKKASDYKKESNFLILQELIVFGEDKENNI